MVMLYILQLKVHTHISLKDSYHITREDQDQEDQDLDLLEGDVLVVEHEVLEAKEVLVEEEGKEVIEEEEVLEETEEEEDVGEVAGESLSDGGHPGVSPFEVGARLRQFYFGGGG